MLLPEDKNYSKMDLTHMIVILISTYHQHENSWVPNLNLHRPTLKYSFIQEKGFFPLIKGLRA